MRTLFNHLQLQTPCLLCQQQDAPYGICTACLALLPYITSACVRCGAPLQTSQPGSVCGNCQAQPPQVDHTRALFHYAPPLAQAIKRLKFHQGLEFARGLGELMARLLQEEPVARPEVLLPVPLHPKRLRSRGYNQSLELARPIAKRLRLPIDTGLCVRTRNTLEQSHLTTSERRRNIRRAFSLQQGAPAYRHIAIIDDVVTTGFTVNELARVLKRAGVERVDVWCCCRA